MCFDSPKVKISFNDKEKQPQAASCHTRNSTIQNSASHGEMPWEEDSKAFYLQPFIDGHVQAPQISWIKGNEKSRVQ